MNSAEWRTASAQHSLGEGTVHLWRAPLDPVPTLEHALSDTEWTRARRFHFHADRERFVASRALLRNILAGYVGIEAGALRFALGAHGKPRLDGEAGGLRFNLSHSYDLMLLAVTRERELGVDLEQMRSDVPFEMLADKFFQPEDARQLRRLPAGERSGKFYEIWTCTEARLKAHGIGLNDGLRVKEIDRWSIAQMTPAPGYAAALAVEGGAFRLELWSWQK
ncbi:MAG: 4'-phosphopantetheinyl transferase superfamily protein [Chthoniobacterales bacterium]